MAEVTGTYVTNNLNAAVQALPDVSLNGGRMRIVNEVVTVAGTEAVNDTLWFARLPSNARLLDLSVIEWDDIGGAGAVMDLGIFNPSGKSGITDDDNALIASLAVNAAGSSDVITDFADSGKALWEHVAAQTSDPKQMLDIKGTIKTAALDAAGDVLIQLVYTID